MAPLSAPGVGGAVSRIVGLFAGPRADPAGTWADRGDEVNWAAKPLFQDRPVPQTAPVAFGKRSFLSFACSFDTKASMIKKPATPLNTCATNSELAADRCGSPRSGAEARGDRRRQKRAGNEPEAPERRIVVEAARVLKDDQRFRGAEAEQHMEAERNGLPYLLEPQKNEIGAEPGRRRHEEEYR